MAHEPAFQERVKKALQNENMKKALRNVQATFRNGRDRQVEIMGNWDEWVDRAKEIRAHVLENLDSYLDQFSTNVEKNGGKVFFAATGQEAIEYITNLAREKNCKTFVKSKSMVSEEIHLNHALEEMGIDVAETDLGEYIIQLAHEPPAHIVGPALHKTREEISELFSQLAGKKLSKDTPTLTRFVRKTLRPKFLNAEIGMTGCNFAVASTGSVVVVTNEGNADMSTISPKAHIVLMGMERIVPDWKSLDVCQTLLPRAATGQAMNVYTNVISGPKQAADIDGPEEWHVVILDNGRSNILGTKYREVLHCIRCGACLNYCPTYRQIGGQAYGFAYSGPIGAILACLLDDIKVWKDLPFACTLCGACTENCSVGIPLDQFILQLRVEAVQKGLTPWSERVAMKAFSTAASNPGLYELGLKIGRSVLRGRANQDGVIEKGPGPLAAWTQHKDFPLPAEQSFRDWWRKEGGNQ